MSNSNRKKWIPAVSTAALLLLTFAILAPAVSAATDDYTNYAPAGMPDFDQKQNNWNNTTGQWSFCGPVAAANCFWWLDSRYADPDGTPGDGADIFPLVQDYDAFPPVPGPSTDDHSYNNVGELVDRLASCMKTDAGHSGTSVSDMEKGIDDWLSATGVNQRLYVHTAKMPTLEYIEEEAGKSNGMILLLGFWEDQGSGNWKRIGGHYVTVAGVNPMINKIAISDPFFDWTYPAASPTTHNNPCDVSHDAYFIDSSAGPGGRCRILYYPVSLGWNILNFAAMNVPPEFEEMQGAWTGGAIYTEIEYAVVILSMSIETATSVRNPETEEWVERINASVGDTVRFRCEVHNDGGSNLADITAANILPESLNYAGSPIVHYPDGAVGSMNPVSAVPPAIMLTDESRLTADPHYERDPSFFEAIDGTYWLFFVRANTPLPHVPPDYDPDTGTYDIYYTTSTDTGDTWSAPAKITHSTGQRGMAAFQDGTGRIWVFVSGPGIDSAIRYYTSTDNGNTWNGPTSTNFAGSYVDVPKTPALWNTIVVFYENDGVKCRYGTNYGTDLLWYPEIIVDANTDMGMPKAVQDASGTLHCVYANRTGGTYHHSTSSNIYTWVAQPPPVDAPGTTGCDPVIYQDASGIYWLFYAPMIMGTDSQWIEAVTSLDGNTWSSRIPVTNPDYETRLWRDMSPEVFQCSDGLLVFYTSEQSIDGNGRADGNIRMRKVSRKALEWTFDDVVLKPDQTITIEFDANVVNSGEDVNLQSAYAQSVETGALVYGCDNSRVNALPAPTPPPAPVPVMTSIGIMVLVGLLGVIGIRVIMRRR
ncbi:MAG: sialidase family protein [Euryarchaeota archaeon]|nr:sialidase family protein [Euryarchaeota archaeon]